MVINKYNFLFLVPKPLRSLIILQFLGWIPRPFGVLLRRLIYPLFLKIGRSVYIQSGTELLGPERIELGDEVKLLRDVRLNANAPNSKIWLGSRVCLDRGVDINVVTQGNCHIEIGDGSYLGPYACLAGPGNITIGKKCLIASQVGIYANNHREYGLSCDGITIEDHCWLGSGVKILDGVTIGKNSVVGAGAVVTKSIPPYSVAVGVPAKVIKRKISESLLVQN